MCPLYMPGNSKIRPPKIEWGPCDFKIPEPYKCQRVIKPGTGKMSAFSYSYKDPNTKKMKILSSAQEEPADNQQFIHRIVFDPDNGDPLVDFLEVWKKGSCSYQGSGLSNGKYMLELFPWWNPTKEGFVAGNHEDVTPSRMMKLEADPSLTSSWTIANSWIIRMRGKRTVFPWNNPDKKETQIYPTDTLGRPGHRVISHDDDIFINVGEIQTGAVVVWTEAQGTRPLILWPPLERSVHHFHVDGEYMVWTESEQWDSSQTQFKKSDIFVAPYSLDQQQVSKTRKKLTKDPRGVSGGSWQVGCGYAARNLAASNPLSNSLMVVRLSDGNSWIIPGGDPSQPWRYDFFEAFGITCEEIFATVGLPSGAPTIVRIRLDSLGPGTPPSE
jgi:hypothetical protein